MARLEFFVVAEDVSVDQTTNQASVFSILEEIRTTDFPTVIPKCVALALWRQEAGDEDRDFQMALRVRLPNGEEHTQETNFRMTRTRHRIINRIQGLPLPGEGQLRFEVLLNGVHAAEHIVTVEQVRPIDAGNTSFH